MACDDNPVKPHDYSPKVGDYADMAGTYEGTAQGLGSSVSEAGEAGLTVHRVGENISGEMTLAVEFGEGPDAISVAFQSAYAGTVTPRAQPYLVLRLDNPVCGGTTEFRGTYSAVGASLQLAGQYVHREADGCSAIAAIDLAISVRKTTQ